MKIVIVTYGCPADPEVFDRHYRDVHTPLVQKMPRLAGFEHSRGLVVTEGERPYLVALLRYASQEDLDASMGSAEGQAALADVPRFATGGANVLTIDTISPF